jgi:hypothetical protein
VRRFTVGKNIKITGWCGNKKWCMKQNYLKVVLIMSHSQNTLGAKEIGVLKIKTLTCD